MANGRGVRWSILLAGIVAGGLVATQLHHAMDLKQIAAAASLMAGLFLIWSGARSERPAALSARRVRISLGVLQLVLAIGFLVQPAELGFAISAAAILGLLAVVLRFPRRFFGNRSDARDAAA